MSRHVRIALCVWTVSFIVFSGIHLSKPRISGVDPYYHIRMGELYRDSFTLHNFPWMTQGILNTAYADKEFGYHALLSLMPSDIEHSELVGPKLLSAALVATIFALFFVLLGDSTIFAMLWTVFFLGSSPLFLYRLVLIRPHVLSILIVMIGLFLLKRNRYKSFAVLNALYTLSYSVPFLLTAIAFIHSLVSKDRKLFYCAVLGNALGLVINPYFPNNLSIIWIQGFHVLKNVFLSQGLSAVELYGIPSRDVLLGFPFLVLVLPALLLKQSKQRQTSYGITLRICNVALFFMTLWSHRFCEYWVPIALLDSYDVFSRYGASLRASRKGAVSAACCGLLVLVMLNVYGMIKLNYPQTSVV